MEQNNSINNEQKSNSDKPVLTLCLMTKADVCAMTSACFTNIALSKFDKYEIATIYCVGQSDLPKARSQQVTMWFDKAKPQDIFMFIDSDQTFTKNDIETSLFYLKNADIVCGAYSRNNGTLTVQPKDPVSFYQTKFGDIWFGSTGFMMFSYEIVNKVSKIIERVIAAKDSDCTTYPFFFERIVEEKDLNMKNMWLGEDYSFCWLARQQGAKVVGYISPTIGHIIPSERFVVIPTYTTWPKNSIAIYCGLTSEKWSGSSIEKGIGGSETAVIKLTKIWASKGYKVVVYCNCDKEDDYDGVTYKDINSFNPLDHFDVLIGWRSPQLFNFVDLHANKCALDLHDVIDPENISKQVISRTNLYFVKSKFHADMLRSIPNFPEEKIVILSNGGKVDRQNVEKDRNYIIYSSSYDRGLPYILKWAWPKIKKACPNAYFKIFYGWEVFDKIRPKTEDTKLYKDTVINLMNQDGVSEYGRIAQNELLKEKAKANIHLYTGHFQEIDCISIRESASLGVIPVVSHEQNVFREKDYCHLVEGQLVEGDAMSREMQERTADFVIRLINDENFADEIRNKMNVPDSETWENVANEWLKKLF